MTAFCTGCVNVLVYVEPLFMRPTMAQYPKMTGSSKKDLSSVVR